jgi:transcription elongation factor Elf1
VKKKRRKKLLKRRRASARSAHQEATYVCDSCGEEIVVPIDISAGSHQDYVEDCPVCCHPMRLKIDIDPDGEAHVAGEHE